MSCPNIAILNNGIIIRVFYCKLLLRIVLTGERKFNCLGFLMGNPDCKSLFLFHMPFIPNNGVCN